MAFIKNCYNVNIGLKNIEEGKIEVKYLISADLRIKELKDDVVTIIYEVNGVVDLLAMGAKLLLGKKLDKMPFKWNPEANEVIVNLRDIDEFKGLLKFFQTTDIHFHKDSIAVLLSIKPTIE
jgi:hypothetical protein